MNEAFLNPNLIVWARKRAQLSLPEVAHAVKANEDQVRSWEQGTTRPAFSKAMVLAKALRVPFATLFLSNPPQSDIQIPDLRTVGSSSRNMLSPDLRDAIQAAMLKQQWFATRMAEEGRPKKKFIGAFDLETPPSKLVPHILKTLGLGPASYTEVSDSSEYLRLLVTRAEDAGILTLRSGVVGANNKRRLSVKEFRGFALVDPLAPLVFVNTNDAKVAQVFTFVHELVHLWIGVSGISDTSGASTTEDAIATELFCNSVAAALLLPATPFREIWNEKPNAKHVSTHFRVSEQVVVRRAADLGIISLSELKELLKAIPNRSAGPPKAGGDFHKTLPVRNSALFTTTLLADVKAGTTTYRDAARLLSVKPGTIRKLQERRK